MSGVTRAIRRRYIGALGAIALVATGLWLELTWRGASQGGAAYDAYQLTAGWLLILALLLLSGLLVFRPMELRLRATIRELTEAKEQIGRSEARCRDLYHRTPAMLCSIDEDARIVSVSDHWLAFSGYQRDELIGRKWLDLLTEESRDHALAVEIPRFLESGTCKDVEYRFVKKNGEVVDVLLSAVADRDESGNLVRPLAVLIDITGQRRIETALRRHTEAMRLLQAIASAANQAMTVEDALAAGIRHIVAFNQWPVGHAFLVEHEPTRLVSAGLWHLADAERFRPFRELTEGMSWRPGVGLPGRVLAAGKPAWTVDIAQDPDCPRQGPLGLKGAFAFPLTVGDEVVAVLEFFSAEAADPDDELLEMVANLGVTLGRAIERARTQETLQRERNFISAVLDTAAALIVVLDGQGRIVEFNKACETLSGYRADEVLGRRVWEFLLDPEEVEPIKQVVDEIYAGKFPNEHENHWVTKDGSRRWLRWSSACLVDERGAVEHLIGIGIDVTERKLARQRIEELARFPDECPQPVIRVAPGGKVLYANRAARALDLLREGPGGLELRAPLDAVARETASPDRPEELEVSVGARSFAFQLVPIPSGPYVNLYGRDITERTPYLLQAQKMQAIGQLTGGVAHDFNNLLTVVLGNLQLISRATSDNPRLQNRIAVAKAAAMRGAELTKRLLAYSRRQVLEPEIVKVNDLVSEMEVLIRQTVDATVAVELHLAPDLWLARVDPNQLETALLNLVLNARDAMAGKAGRLVVETANTRLDEGYVRLHPYAQTGDFLMIAVTDNGGGMPPEVVARVFEPFFTTKDVGKGTGLGLSMVYGFIKQSGGYIDVYSEVGHGTTVRLYLPYAGPATEHAARPDIQAGGLAGALGSEIVLLVEDQEEVRDIAVAMVRDLDYRVLEADNGPHALEVLDRHPEIDLLFTDVVMPGGMNGAQLAVEACRRQPGLKVLFASGYPENAISAGGILKRGCHYIAKPYQQDDLARKLREVLDGEQAGAQQSSALVGELAGVDELTGANAP